MDLMQMWQSMGYVAKGVAFILFVMSMWSFGVAIERIFTYTQARNQSKLYAPQVAKHLKEGRLKDAIANLFAKQTSAGAFGLWGPDADGDSDDLWLDAYVTEFLLLRRALWTFVSARAEELDLSNVLVAEEPHDDR